jgi:hypothetical protein
MKNKTVLGVTLSKLIGLMIFLGILELLNNLQIENVITLQILNFLNDNLGIIVIFSVLFYLGELFSIFVFPLNVLYPLFNAIGSIFLVRYIFNIIYALDNFLKLEIFPLFDFLEIVTIAVVFVIVIIVGYITILVNLIPKRKKKVNFDGVVKEFKNVMNNLRDAIKKLIKK